MNKLSHLNPKRVFEIFEEICTIPHGSSDMEKISLYCENFAIKNGLNYIKDDALNVIIFKPGTKGYENSEQIILQGHLDMVCQKEVDFEFDFLKDGIEVFEEYGYVKANKTTLGADNGIAVAMVMAILESNNIAHPPICALFTTDEETGMLGASKLDFSLISAKKLINIDSETEDVLTVSCAGGSDFKALFKKETENKTGTKVKLVLKGLLGGHSGVEIHKNRVNSSILSGRFLNALQKECEFSLIDINGGDKTNAITNRTEITVCTNTPDILKEKAVLVANNIKNEIKDREPNFDVLVSVLENGEFLAFSQELTKKLVCALMLTPSGVCEMSANIDGLVETSLNLGILKTEEDKISLHYFLRSNKTSSLVFLEERLNVFYNNLGCETKTFGHTPPWEYKEDSALKEVYKKCFKEIFVKEPKIEAIHAGLECAIFTSKIDGIDCISLGPNIFDAHTTKERLSVESTQKIYTLLLKMLENLK